jgi:hypothetical protein
VDGPKEGLTTNILGGFDGANDTLIEIDLAASSKGTYDINRQLSTEAARDLKVKLVKTQDEQSGFPLLLDDELVNLIIKLKPEHKQAHAIGGKRGGGCFAKHWIHLI